MHSAKFHFIHFFRSPSTVARQLFPDKQKSQAKLSTNAVSSPRTKTTEIEQPSKSTNKPTSAVKATVFEEESATIESRPSAKSVQNPAQTILPPQNTNEFSLFNKKEAFPSHVLGNNEEDRLDFAHVAASGVPTLATTIATVTTASGTIPLSTKDMVDQFPDPAMAPGYNIRASSHISSSSHLSMEQDMKPLPGAIGSTVRGPGVMMDGPHIATTRSLPTPIGSETVSNNSVGAVGSEKSYKDLEQNPVENVASLMQALQLHHSNLSLSESKNLPPNDTRAQMQQQLDGQDGMNNYKPIGSPSLQQMSGPRSAPPTPRMNHQSTQQQQQQQQMQQQQQHQRLLERYHYQQMVHNYGQHQMLSSLLPPGHHQEYSTPNKPMTLPRIESTLNPNAPDFTSSRMTASLAMQNQSFLSHLSASRMSSLSSLLPENITSRMAMNNMGPQPTNPNLGHNPAARSVGSPVPGSVQRSADSPSPINHPPVGVTQQGSSSSQGSTSHSNVIQTSSSGHAMPSTGLQSNVQEFNKAPGSSHQAHMANMNRGSHVNQQVN